MNQSDQEFLYRNAFANAVDNLLGTEKRSAVTPSIYEDQKYVRRALKECADKVQQTLQTNITLDDRLSHTTQFALNQLRESIADKTGPINLGAIASLLQLVVFLLGFDHNTGKINRHIVYYQTLDQIQFDTDKLLGNGNMNSGIEGLKQSELIQQLLGEGYKPTQIATIMNMSVAAVKTRIRNHDNFNRYRDSLMK